MWFEFSNAARRGPLAPRTAMCCDRSHPHERPKPAIYSRPLRGTLLIPLETEGRTAHHGAAQGVEAPRRGNMNVVNNAVANGTGPYPTLLLEVTQRPPREAAELLRTLPAAEISDLL